MSAAHSSTPPFVDPFRNYGEVDADLATIEEWGRANGVQKVDGRFRISDIAYARSKVGLPKFNLVAGRVLNGAASETKPMAGEAERLPGRQPAQAPPTLGTSPTMPTTEFELVDLVTGYSGTITGLVSPQLAEWLLALNLNNRPMSPRAIDRFIKILRRGAWQNTGEPIIVANNGQLSDGQHRLTAIRRTGIAAECDLRLGIARQAFAVTGTGARRTLGNALAIAGKPHASMQAAIGRLLVQYDAGAIHHHNIQVDTDLVIAATEAEPAVGAVAALIRPLKFKPTRTAPFGFALVLAQRATSIDQAAAFAHLVDGGKAEEDDASRRLHVRLRDAAMAKERLSQLDVAILTVRAWNAWITGKPVQQLRVTDADRVADGFPKVVGG